MPTVQQCWKEKGVRDPRGNLYPLFGNAVPPVIAGWVMDCVLQKDLARCGVCSTSNCYKDKKITAESSQRRGG
jgi:hypothetical protein